MTNSSNIIPTKKNPTKKRCTKCGLSLPVTKEFFHKDSTKKYGFRSNCKVCSLKESKEYRESNKEKIKEYKKEYRESNKEKIKEYRESNKEKIKEYLKRNKEKIKEYLKRNKEKIKDKSKEYYESNKDKIKEKSKEYHKEYRESNKEKIKEYYESNKEKIKEYNKKRNLSPCLFKSPLVQRLSIYDEIRESQEGYVDVKCAYCGMWITPQYEQIKKRVAACESTHTGGENRIYCNDNNDSCKLACPTYRQHNYPKGFKPATSREVEPLIRQLCFERDNWTCQHCGVTSREAQLHCHHIIGVVHSPIEQNDISNTITLCKACHKALHKKSGCTYQDYKCA